MDALEKHVLINALLDYYVSLLTDKQAVMMRHYYLDNYSLQEIAELHHISRNAVHDHIQKTTQKLLDLEAKLGLHDKALKRQQIIDKLKQATDQKNIQSLLNELEKVE